MSYIPHRLLVINEYAGTNLDDAVMNECYRLAFDWANDMGRKGKRVFGLFLQRPDPKNHDPVRQQSHLWCKIECTVGEREIWEEMQEIQARQYVLDMLKEE